MKAGVFISGVGLATPPLTLRQEEVLAFIERHFAGGLSPRGIEVMRKVFLHPSVKRRHFALDSPGEVLAEGPDGKIARFTERAVSLSAEAVVEALKRAGRSASEISALVVNTCTGYICPGLSTYLIERLGLRDGVKAYDLVGGGCGGAVPNLELAGLLKNSLTGGVVVSVSVEICTATFQMEDNLSLIVSNALFSDGAAAAVLTDRSEGIKVVASSSRYAPEHRDSIRYVHKNGQLHNRLSVALPRLVKNAASEVVGDILRERDLRMGDIVHWAVHPGGEKILDSVRDGLGLPEEKLWASRKVLSEHGNMSSPTVWFVLREIMDAGVVRPGDRLMMLAFGAGLSAHAAFMRIM